MNSEKTAQIAKRQLAPGEERRRSQRVTLRVAVKLHISIEGKPPTVLAFTSNVNDHGALIHCRESFATNARFVLEHINTQQRIGCRVTRPPQGFGDEFLRAESRIHTHDQDVVHKIQHFTERFDGSGRIDAVLWHVSELFP